MSGPQIEQQIDVILAGGEPLDARVDDERDGALLLMLLDGPHPDALSGAHATIHFTNKRGVCSLDGRLCDAVGARVWFAPEGRTKLIQRREHVRVEATVPVIYSPDGKRREEGYTLDVSGGGFVLGNPVGLSIGGTTHFTLQLGEEPLEAFGTAVRETGRGGLAIQLDVIAPGARERLIHWIFRRERLARAYARGR